MFDKAGSPIPELGRAAIGFTSRGGKGNCLGECWSSVASADKHFEIFIRPDQSDPVEVLGVLVHELVHSAVPIGSGHGPIYKALALKIGLEGKMRHAMPGMHLQEILKELAADLGPLPHAALDISFREQGKRKKQKTHMLKAFCEGVTVEDKHETCDFICRLTKEHASKGAPFCGIHNTRMVVQWPSEDESGEDETPGDEEAEGAVKHPEPPTPPVSHEPAGVAAITKNPNPAPVQPSPGYRFTSPDEVHQPGQTFKVNVEAGQTEVLITPPSTPENEETSHAL
jgi:hypothetical protein